METRCGETPPDDLNRDGGRSAQRSRPLGSGAAVAAGSIAKVTLLLGEGQNPPWHRFSVARATFVPSHAVAGETKRRTRQARSVALRRTDGAKPEPRSLLDDRAARYSQSEPIPESLPLPEEGGAGGMRPRIHQRWGILQAPNGVGVPARSLENPRPLPISP